MTERDEDPNGARSRGFALANVPRFAPEARKRVPADPADYFSAEELERARAYRRPLQRAEMLNAAITVAAIVAIVWSGAARALIDALGVTAWPLQVVVSAVLVVVTLTIASIPASAWETFGHESRWGFNTKTVPTFVRDQAVEIFVMSLLLTAMTLPVWALIRATDLWWLWGALALTLVVFVFAFLFPLVILPLSNRFTPLEDAGLVGRLQAVADRAGVRPSGFFVMDASKRTRKDNAFVAGIGASRKVVLFDNLLGSPPEHIESVVAHEIGHWRRGHVLRGLTFQVAQYPVLLAIVAAITAFGPVLRWAGVADLGDPAAVPVFLLAAGAASAITGRSISYVIRWQEREADIDALENTRDPANFRATMHGLAVKNLPDIDPSWWARTKATHPPIAERLAFADAWERRNGTRPDPSTDEAPDQGVRSI